MRLSYYHVDAFTSRPFGGNPAGVCPLEHWLPDETLQSIAAENNLAETAFFTRQGDDFKIRWFTPTMEVDLCGHATLASAHVLYAAMGHSAPRIRFHSLSGWLSAARHDEIIELDFPSRPPVACSAPEELLRGLGCSPREVLKSRDYMAVFDSAEEIASLQPDMNALIQLDCLGVIATAPGHDADFVSRFFAPRAGIPEDPATGSSHCSLVPYWAGRLGKTALFGRQISKRGGEIHCRHLGERVGIGGNAVIYSKGELSLPGTGA
jgi:predicted PhzF superfamily epimerase YddE/YHI9